MKISLFLFLSLSLLCLLPLVEANNKEQTKKEKDYYTMVNDVLEGINYYEVLGVEQECEIKDIRRAFRRLSLKLHPDKRKENSPEIEEQYLNTVRAYEMLMDEHNRYEFDILLRDGVPWHERYYGRYAHRFGAPTHDIRKVLLFCFAGLTVFHYCYCYNRWKTKRRRVREHPLYQRKLKQAQDEKKYERIQRKKLKAAGKKVDYESDGEEITELPEAFVHIDNLDYPKWTDTLVVRFFELPWTIVYFYIYKFLLRYTADYDERKERDIELMEKFGLTEDQLEFERQKQQKRVEKVLSSSKYKRYQRWMKKMGKNVKQE